VNARLTKSAIWGGAVYLVALVLCVSLGAFRLWPRISGQQLPWSLIWPFARPLLAAMLELSFLVTPAVALGLTFGGREPRTGSISTLIREASAASLLLCIALGGVSFGSSLYLDGAGSSPGQLASELVATARASCVESAPRAEVSVPLLGFSWVCEARRTPHLEGRAPIGPDAHFQAETVALGDDLKQIELTHFELGFPVQTLSVRVRAGQATLNGLPPWGRSRRLPLGLRALLFAFSAFACGLGTAMALGRTWPLPRWAGAVLGAAVSAAVWFAQSRLERSEPRPLSYASVPAAGLAVLVAWLLLDWVAGRVRARAAKKT